LGRLLKAIGVLSINRGRSEGKPLNFKPQGCRKRKKKRKDTVLPRTPEKAKNDRKLLCGKGTKGKNTKKKRK